MERALIKLTQRIREEFEEAPGLRMNVAEASRFWGMDEGTAEQVLARLLANGFLAKDANNRYGERKVPPAQKPVVALREPAARDAVRRCA